MMNELFDLMTIKEREANTKGSLYIPHEIVKDILSRLYGKYLFRFKSVCKLWHETISDYHKPKFIVACPLNYRSFNFTLINPEDGHVITSWVWPWRYDEKLKNTRKVFKDQIVNSCNGLLLVVFQDKFYLWNPVTRFPIKVLESLPFYDMDYQCGRQLFIVGLCHDSRSWKDEYKVLLIVIYLHCGRYFPSIFVCGLKEKRYWKEIRFPLDDLGAYDNISKINFNWMLNFNGMLHWVFSYYFTKNPVRVTKQVLMYYKPETDEIKELPKPERAECPMVKIVGLGTLLGHLSIVLMSRGRVEVLIMNEYGVKDSWKCMFTFKDPRCNVNLYCLVAQTWWHSKMMNDGEIELQVLEHSYTTEIVKFNPNTQIREKISWDHENGPFNTTTCSSVVEYVESLVSPTGYDWSGKHHEHLLRFENIEFLQRPKQAIN